VTVWSTRCGSNTKSIPLLLLLLLLLLTPAHIADRLHL
jgi:hypothetical protein